MTERVQIALSASGTSPIGRGKFPSSARCAEHHPRGEGFGERIVTRRNPTVIPGTDSELVGADALIGPMENVLKLEWVDVLNRPTQILTKVF